MKTPVVKSSSPQELQLIVELVVREINYLRDLIYEQKQEIDKLKSRDA